LTGFLVSNCFHAVVPESHDPPGRKPNLTQNSFFKFIQGHLLWDQWKLPTVSVHHISTFGHWLRKQRRPKSRPYIVQ